MRYDRVLEVFARKGSFIGLEIPIQTGDGNVTWISSNGVPILDVDGKLLGCQGSDTDITERKLAEEALSESEEKYHMLVENAPSVLWKTNENGISSLISSNIKEVYGYTPEEIYKEDHIGWFAGIHQDDLTKVKENFQALFDQGKKFEVEYRIKRKDGKWIWAHDVAKFVSEENGERYAYGVFTDITERKRAEEQLRKERDFSKSLIDTAQTIILALDPRGRIVSFNPYMENISGYRLEEVQGKDWFESFLPGRDHDRIRDIFKKSVNNIQTHGNVNSIITKDGRELEIEWYDKTLVSVEGDTIGVLATGQDITERKLVEEALWANEEKYRGLFDESVAAVYVFDTEKNFLDTNQSGLDLLGYPRDELLKLSIPDVDADTEVVLPAHQKLLGGDRLVDYEHKLIRKDGTIITVLNNSKSLTDSDGNVVGMQSTLIDITKRKLAEEEAEKSRKQLRELTSHLQDVRENERTILAREIHDELGQVLTALSMDLSWIFDQLPEEQKSIKDKTKSMEELVDSTVQIVKRISSELRPGLLDDIGLSAAMEWQLEEFKKRTGIPFKLRLTHEEAEIDNQLSTVIFRIFQESLTNIMRHANATQVKVDLSVEDESILLKVDDNGKGITSQQITDPKSFGLLGIRERVDSFNGQMKINGIPDNGTTLTVDIPLIQVGL
ncbi:MAG: PAS domain S-box protein [Candidatus Electryonea clarkiae]|nr:PAS domain S-box protein [Candidatus Electryonea clarkiae]MDP8288885.1 PAS domain S-box protein [Candidatus Electryonea clarkiae]